MSEYECREAAAFVHAPWSDWRKLDIYERAASVAHYRLNILIKTNLDDAAQTAAKNRASKRRNKAS